MEKKLGIFLIIVGLIAIGSIISFLIISYNIAPDLVYYENRVTIIFYISMALIVLIIFGIYLIVRKL